MDVERLKSEMGLLEKISTYVPGYRGYKEKELRRETDILIRRKISSVLSEAKAFLNSPLSPSAARKLAYEADAKFAFENVRTSFDRITQRIDKAVAGYAGLFDAVKVREDKLDAVIRHDLALLQKADSLKTFASELMTAEPASSEWKTKLNQIQTALNEFDRLVDERTQILKGLVEVGR
ncbi:MAG: hypothetical protein RMI43_02440 [Candidatus Caldarchaeum sp.]|nr:hypothetical protein [Candidatus Caldarchaeum sp.]MCX8201207.1 hypothetical protein [Candidatus Caldarchaeum sp.]MDW8063011.1 hypothetical protein [Candidatus Caldarchaeum sp.]MDW8435414.1 hypothetical protein [Candidatus Caldarchaeum sp.]